MLNSSINLDQSLDQIKWAGKFNSKRQYVRLAIDDFPKFTGTDRGTRRGNEK